MPNQDREIHLCREALYKWGFNTQIYVAVEELAELIKALMKYLRYRQQDNAKNVVEEIADVEIMLMQLNILFGSHNIEKVKKEKLERLEKLLLEGKHDH